MPKTIITVEHTELDGYGNLTVTTKAGGEPIKIGEKRSHLHPLFEPGVAIELDWQTFNNRKYVADARLVEGELPPPVKPSMGGSEGDPPKQEKVIPDDKMTKEDWANRDAKRDRSVTLAYAKDLAAAGQIEVTKIIFHADLFDKWVSGEITVPPEVSVKYIDAVVRKEKKED